MDETVAQICYSPRSLELARKLQDPAITTPYWKSRLLSLPVDQLAALVEWLLVDQATYEEIRLRLWQRFQVRSSLPALSKFWRRRLTPLAITSRDRRANGSIQITVYPALANKPAQVTVRSTAPVILQTTEVRK